jgi:thiol:disulfide interchange protein DsbG
MHRTGCVLSVLLWLPLMGSAQPVEQAATASPDAHLPPALHPVLQAGFKVTRDFPAAGGLTGWVLRAPDGEYNVFYSTPDGQYLMAGALVSGDGENLTQRYVAQYVPKPDLTALWQRFEKANIVTSGAQRDPKGVLYVIMDPNCIFCHFLWMALKPYEAAGLQVRWIPVGFLHQDSAGKAAAVLKGGETAFERMQQGFDEATESAGITPVEVTPALQVQLDANLALMRDAAVRGTPGIFYKDDKGAVHRRDGMPMLSELPRLTGLPEQAETDPSLARFKH